MTAARPVMDPAIQVRAEQAAWFDKLQTDRLRRIARLGAEAVTATDADESRAKVTAMCAVAQLYLDKVSKPRPPRLDQVTVITPPQRVDL